MTKDELEHIKAVWGCFYRGEPDHTVARLVREVERCWGLLYPHADPNFAEVPQPDHTGWSSSHRCRLNEGER